MVLVNPKGVAADCIRVSVAFTKVLFSCASWTLGKGDFISISHMIGTKQKPLWCLPWGIAPHCELYQGGFVFCFSFTHFFMYINLVVRSNTFDHFQKIASIIIFRIIIFIKTYHNPTIIIKRWEDKKFSNSGTVTV